MHSIEEESVLLNLVAEATLNSSIESSRGGNGEIQTGTYNLSYNFDSDRYVVEVLKDSWDLEYYGSGLGLFVSIQ